MKYVNPGAKLREKKRKKEKNRPLSVVQCGLN